MTSGRFLHPFSRQCRLPTGERMMHYHLKVFFSRPRFSCAQAFICSLLAFVATTDVTAAPETHGLLEITGTKTPYLVQFLVPGSDYLSIHGLTFDSHDQLYVGSVMGQAIYTVDLASGNSSEFIGPPHGMSDDLEFGPDGTLVWTSILTSGTCTTTGWSYCSTCGEFAWGQCHCLSR